MITPRQALIRHWLAVGEDADEARTLATQALSGLDEAGFEIVPLELPPLTDEDYERHAQLMAARKDPQ